MAALSLGKRVSPDDALSSRRRSGEELLLSVSRVAPEYQC
jgi:hypothetical protein